MTIGATCLPRRPPPLPPPPPRTHLLSRPRPPHPQPRARSGLRLHLGHPRVCPRHMLMHLLRHQALQLQRAAQARAASSLLHSQASSSIRTLSKASICTRPPPPPRKSTETRTLRARASKVRAVMCKTRAVMYVARMLRTRRRAPMTDDVAASSQAMPLTSSLLSRSVCGVAAGFSVKRVCVFSVKSVCFFFFVKRVCVFGFF